MSKTEEIKTLFNEYVMPTYSPKLVLEKGRGTKVWDTDGKVYLDFTAGISVNNVGHCHPRVVDAIQRQAADLMHVSNHHYTENQARLAWRLSRLSLDGKVFFCNSGAEANEGLIKLARLWGHESEKFEVISMTGSFHGRTLATLAATGQEKVQEGFEPMPEGFYPADFNDLDCVRAMITDNTVAVLVEAIQGEGGVVPAEEAFFKGIRELCDEHNLLMLCDEVQCGMGRTGSWFGYQAYGVTPDAISVAKALGSGYPIGAVVAGPKLADVFSPGKHASTFGGNPLACAAGLATLDVIEDEDLVAKASRSGAKFQAALEELVGRYEHVSGVRGRGLMLGLVLDQDAVEVTDCLRDMGLLTLPTAGNVIRLLPPLNVKDGELEEAIEMIDEALEIWHDDLNAAAEAVAEAAGTLAEALVEDTAEGGGESDEAIEEEAEEAVGVTDED
ncbi:MAG: aspartate aminotransferase family protein [Lentisphaerae bacterium]|nr:aspartate aminotransferase family protein [Lentisphaerota bacterium]